MNFAKIAHCNMMKGIIYFYMLVLDFLSCAAFFADFTQKFCFHVREKLRLGRKSLVFRCHRLAQICGLFS